jgi:hypothetical protein
LFRWCSADRFVVESFEVRPLGAAIELITKRSPS